MALISPFGFGALKALLTRLLGTRFGKALALTLTGMMTFLVKALITIVGIAVTAWLVAQSEWALQLFSYLVAVLFDFMAWVLDNPNTNFAAAPDWTVFNTIGVRLAKLMWLLQVPQIMGVALYYFLLTLLVSFIKLIIFRRG